MYFMRIGNSDKGDKTSTGFAIMIKETISTSKRLATLIKKTIWTSTGMTLRYRRQYVPYFNRIGNSDKGDNKAILQQD
jgi:hypothetical protein